LERGSSYWDPEMSWVVKGTLVAEPRSLSVEGKRSLGGIALTIEVKFHMMEWKGWMSDPPCQLSLVPLSAPARFVMERSRIDVGIALPVAPRVFYPARHSTEATIVYELPLSRGAFTELEEARNAGSIRLNLRLEAVGTLPREATSTSVHEIEGEIPRDRWLSILAQTGFEDVLLFEVPLNSADPKTMREPEKRLRAAVAKRSSSSPVESMAAARKVSDALKQGGFGGKPAKRVVQFLQENAGSLSMSERYSVLHAALNIYAAPTHHANYDDSEFTRTDADMVLCMAAALVKLAAIRGQADE